jgi:hypothetical protein
MQHLVILIRPGGALQSQDILRRYRRSAVHISDPDVATLAENGKILVRLSGTPQNLML